MQPITRTRRLLTASVTTIGALALVGGSFTGTAFATGDHGDRAKGGERSGSQSWTEDNDTNDGGTRNNVADDGDNRHPSGKDRSVEHGGSGNQGKSKSDPDGDSNGGHDKANGSGGWDKADQDGNNGCGNDDDFEDDNNGNCGGKAKAARAERPKSHDKSKADKVHDKGCNCEKPATTTTTVAPAAKPAKAEKAKGEKSENCRDDDEKSQREAVAAHRNKADHDKADDDKVKTVPVAAAKPTILVSATCSAVTVTSTKDITKVYVTFADGETVKFHVDGTEWTKTFDRQVVSAKAKSAGAEATGMATGCATPTTAATSPAMVTPPAPTTTTTEAPGVLSATAPAAASPAAPAEVLGISASAGAPAAVEVTPVAARSTRPAGVLGSVTGALAFTGANALTLLAAALLAIAIGWALLRADKRRSRA